MKIAFYNSSDGVYQLVARTASISGGAIKQQWLLALALIANGHEVLFITPTSDPKSITAEINGLRFVASPATTTNINLRRILVKENPAWLYWRCNSMHLGPCFFLAKSAGISTVFACASDKDCIPQKALNPFGLKKYFWLLYKWGLDLADRILIQHPGQQKLLGAHYHHKIRPVNNIATIPEVQKRKVAPYIVWVGNLRWEKRPDILIEIAKRLPQYQFVACGAVMDHRSKPGYARTASETLQSMPNVDYRGVMPPQEALALIGNASLLLSTSELEGFPNTMLEAWSLGVPVISWKLDIGGIITRHELGRVTNDVGETVTVIDQFMANHQERTRSGNAGISYVMKHHAPEDVYRQLAEALTIQDR